MSCSRSSTAIRSPATTRGVSPRWWNENRWRSWGNALVFRVSRGAFVGVGGYESLEDAFLRYRGDQPLSDPMRVSLPTGGVYAQALKDRCNACEEHFGSTDWILDRGDILPQEFEAGLFASRRAVPQGLTPTAMPDTLINLQNAPAAPAPAGLEGALDAVTSSGAFRDMTGLAGTQGNAKAVMEAAKSLASEYGNLTARQMLAELEANRRIEDSDIPQEVKDSLRAKHGKTETSEPDCKTLDQVISAADRGLEAEQTSETPTTKVCTKAKPSPPPPPPPPPEGRLQLDESGYANYWFVVNLKDEYGSPIESAQLKVNLELLGSEGGPIGFNNGEPLPFTDGQYREIGSYPAKPGRKFSLHATLVIGDIELVPGHEDFEFPDYTGCDDIRGQNGHAGENAGREIRQGSHGQVHRFFRDQEYHSRTASAQHRWRGNWCV